QGGSGHDRLRGLFPGEPTSSGQIILDDLAELGRERIFFGQYRSQHQIDHAEQLGKLHVARLLRVRAEVAKFPLKRGKRVDLRLPGKRSPASFDGRVPGRDAGRMAMRAVVVFGSPLNHAYNPSPSPGAATVEPFVAGLVA